MNHRRPSSLVNFVFGPPGHLRVRMSSAPLVHDVRVEVIHFVYAAVVITAVSVLSIRLGKLRNRLSRQKKELQEAVERIQTLATRDALTGLLNQHAMLEALSHEAQRTQCSAAASPCAWR